MENQIEKLVDNYSVGSFYTQKDFWFAPLFSASSRPSLVNSQLELNLYDDEHSITVSYLENKMPGWVECKIYSAVEYLWWQNYKSKLQTMLLDVYSLIEKHKLDYMNDFKVSENNMSDSDNQLCIYKALCEYKQRVPLKFKLSVLAEMIYPGKNATSRIKKGLIALNKTKIKAGSEFSIGKDNYSELYIDDLPLLYVNMSSTRYNGNTIVELNEIHLLGMLSKHYHKRNVILIHSLSSAIAGLGYRYLSPKIDGCIKYRHNSYKLNYLKFTESIHANSRKKKVEINRQMLPALREWKEKGIISDYSSLSKDMYGEWYYDLIFSEKYYFAYYKALDKSEQCRIEQYINDNAVYLKEVLSKYENTSYSDGLSKLMHHRYLIASFPSISTEVMALKNSELKQSDLFD